MKKTFYPSGRGSGPDAGRLLGPGFQHPRFPCTGFCPGILQRILLRGLRTCILR